MTLGIISLPAAPRPAKDFEEYKRSVETWARQVEQTVRQFERVVNDLNSRLAALERG